MPNVLTMLKSDHATIKRLTRELSELEGNSATTLKRREKNDEAEHMFYEAAEEHHVVDMVLPALKAANPKSHEFQAKAKVLKELLEHHIKEEETQMFAQAREMFSEEQLRELGDLMQARKDSVQAMWDNPLLRPVKKLQSVAHKLMPTKVKTAKANAIAKGMEAAGR
jgi:hypothetical protein